jgi:very-short-patch-repair endonuclease
MGVLSDFLRRHDGVITLEQACEAGLSRRAIERRVASGRWVRCARGVYFVDDRPFTDAARIRAAVWGYGARGAASGLTAAWWHGLTRFAPVVAEVTMPRDSHGRRHPGTRVRRRNLDPVDVVEVNDMRVTALGLTVVEAAAKRGGGAKLMDNALQRRTDLDKLWRAHLRNKGRTGAPRSRMLLQAAGGGARSEAERLLHQLLRDAGITGWKANYRVGGYRVDVGFPAAKLALETDGFAFHSGVHEFQVDRTRQNAIVLLGWQVLRFTWLDLTEYPERVTAAIRAALSAR